METKALCFKLISAALPITLSESTRKTYCSVLVNHYIQYGMSCFDCIQFYNSPIFLDTLATRKINTQATILAAAYALTNNVDILQRMHSTSKVIKEAYKDQILSETRKAVSLSSAEVNTIFYEYLARYNADKSARNLTDVLITGLMSGVFSELPPRRLLEYTELKPHPPPRSVKGQIPAFNYVINGPHRKMWMLIYHHKTSGKSTTPHMLPVPDQLSHLILKASREGREFLLLNERGAKFTSASLHNRLMAIYGFGVDMLRSIYLSNMHKGSPKLRKMEKIAKLMGNSVNAQVTCYVKKS